ncbi:hypothetical protein FOCC_FOCC009071 [Frankliniella occidentalis]|nr:hypothetical protein FOCC_FOCC009071 [Frankliniella occidentalis]
MARSVCCCVAAVASVRLRPAVCEDEEPRAPVSERLESACRDQHLSWRSRRARMNDRAVSTTGATTSAP